MQHADDSAPSPPPQTFAGLLASLASPKPKTPPAWNDDGLADDVATLSYENALRTHARYRSTDPTDRSLTQPVEPIPFETYELAQVPEAPEAKASIPLSSSPAIPVPEPVSARQPAPLFEQNLKSASVTIRLSQAECAQLHRRAAEAGLTVSAYLRSCTFEAESLRAMVKETMAQLKSATAAGKRTAPAEARQSWFGLTRGRLAKVFSPWQGSRRVARV
jgi:hypothetical protein